MYEIKDNIISIELDDDFVEHLEQKEEEEDNKIVQKVLEEIIPQIPLPKNGEDGKDGKTPTKTEIKEIIKPLIPKEKEIIEKVLNKIPKPKDGEKGDKGEDGKSFRFADLTAYEKQILTGPQGSNGVGVPRYGTTGQKLVKASSKDFDTEWADDTSGFPTLQQVTDEGNTTTNDIIVPDEAYGAGWNGSMEVPTKNAIYDKIQTITTTPGGSDTQIQFNDGGSFGGDSGFTYNKTTDTASITKTGLGATPTAGLQVINSTAATVGTPSQVSPSFLRKGNGFFSNSSTSFPFEVQDYVSGDTNIVAYGKHIWQYRANSGSWAEFMSFSTAPLGLGFSITPGQSLSNGTPGTTRNMTINNTGTNSWIDWKFSGVAKSYLGADSSGAMKFFAGGGSYFEYYQMAGGSLFSYNYPTAFVHSGNGLFGGSVNAGSQSTPTSTLQSQGSFATKGRRVTSNYTLTTTDSVIYADATTPTCNGTPTYACSHWTNQTDCEKWDAHGGCSWYAGDSCSVYNGDQGGCQGQSGCTYDTASCSSFGDESSCNGTSGCSWTNNPLSCSGFDEYTCSMTSGCTVDTGYCSWDGMTCSGGGDCSAQMDESSCLSYSYYNGCSGSYDNYSCSGDYYTGNCSGMYGAVCQGSPSCAGIDDSTNCGLETGCSWTTSITISLPSVISTPERHYWVYNDNSGSADVVLSPFSGDTIDKTTSYTLGTYKDSVHIHALAESTSCDSFNEGACTPSGCTKNYANCSWDSGSSTCSGNAVCDGIGDQYSCESTTYYSGCSGIYYTVKNWYLLSRS